MAKIPSTVAKRLITKVPKFKKILAKAKADDINEADTVAIVADMLEEIFGFDKYEEITREYEIKGTFCDLAIKTNKKIDYLIEAKAIGINLKDIHLKQAINYAANEGIKWVVLTNGINWQVHCVTLKNKISSKELFTLNFEEINHKKEEEQEQLFLLCKKGVSKDLISEYAEVKKYMNRYIIGALLQAEPIAKVVKFYLQRLKGGIKADIDEISKIIRNDVIKRELLDTEEGIEADKQITKFMKKKKK